MSNKEEILDILEPGDVLLRSADNGVIIYGIHPKASKEDGPSCIDSTVVKFDGDTPSQDSFKTMIDKILNEMQIYGGTYDFDVVLKEKDK